MGRQHQVNVSRTIPKEWKRPIDRHALTIGQIVWASNYLHTYFHLAFRWAIGDDAKANEMWHEERNDGPQRGLLTTALEGNNNFSPRDRARLLWAVKKAVKLAELRNDLVHLPLVPISITRVNKN